MIWQFMKNELWVALQKVIATSVSIEVVVIDIV